MRWIAQDPTTGVSYSFPLSPNKMTTPFPALAAQSNAAAGAWGIGDVNSQGPKTRLVNADPASWTFGGFIHSADLLSTLQSIYKLKHRFYLTDHLGRTFIARLMFVDVNEHQPSLKAPTRYEYTATAISYGLVTPLGANTFPDSIRSPGAGGFGGGLFGGGPFGY